MATDITGSLGTVARSGLLDTLSAIDATGNSFTNTGVEWVEVNNGGGTTTTVNVAYSTTLDGQAIPAKTVAIAAGARRKIGPFPTTWFNDGNGKVNLTYTGNTTTVTIGLFKLGS